MEDTRTRDYYFDNAKFLLVILLLEGHAIEPLIYKYRPLLAVYVLIYSFHIPLFAFISGYFTRPGAYMNDIRKSALALLSPYIVLQVIYSIFNGLVFKVPAGLDFSMPYWILWYLPSLFFWRALLPLFKRIRYPVVFAIALSLAAGYVDGIGYRFSLSRTIVFFPMFLAGHGFDRGLPESLGSGRYRAAAIALLAAGASASWIISAHVDVGWLYGSRSYASLGHREWYAALYRVACYFAAFLMGSAFLLLVPKKKTAFSEAGSRSMYPFLLHGFIARAALACGVYNFAGSPAAVAALFLAGAAVAVVLSSRYTRMLAMPLVEPLKLAATFSRP